MTFRISIRQIMAIVLLLALVLGLGVPAVEVYTKPEYHMHQGSGANKYSVVAQSGIRAPFWPRYIKRLKGERWLKQACNVRVGLKDERCELPVTRW